MSDCVRLIKERKGKTYRVIKRKRIAVLEETWHAIERSERRRDIDYDPETKEVTCPFEAD